MWLLCLIATHSYNLIYYKYMNLLLKLYFILFYYLYIYFLLHFWFWDTCAEYAELLHRYIHGNVVRCLHPITSIWHFSPCYPSPNPHPCFPFPNSPQQTQCVTLPSLCLWVLIVQHPPMSENMWCLIFCSCVSLLRMMVSIFIHVPTKYTNSSFFMAA